jgi:hypothetical protein
MNILRLAGELFLIYIIYKFIFDFIIPIYNTTKKVKKQFGDMQDKMNQQMNTFNQQQQQQQPNRPPVTPVKPVSSKEDYIDYEEVK